VANDNSFAPETSEFEFCYSRIAVWLLGRAVLGITSGKSFTCAPKSSHPTGGTSQLSGGVFLIDKLYVCLWFDVFDLFILHKVSLSNCFLNLLVLLAYMNIMMGFCVHFVSLYVYSFRNSSVVFV